jgi:hypothetical protein
LAKVILRASRVHFGGGQLSFGVAFMDAREFAIGLASLLAELGNSITEPSIRSDAKDCRDQIYADNLAHGGSVEAPFFNFVVLSDVAVFTFFEAEFSVYVLRCNEAELISRTNRFAMADTLDCKAFLAAQYQKHRPDLVISRSVCEQWLESA